MNIDHDISRKVQLLVGRLRFQRGWTQKQLADKIGLDRSTIAARTSRPLRRLSLDEAFALATVFGLTLDELVRAAFGECPQCAGKPPEGYSCNACGGGQ